MWNEEFSRIIQKNIEIESRKFIILPIKSDSSNLSGKINLKSAIATTTTTTTGTHYHQPREQGQHEPMFLGDLIRSLLVLTDARKVVYSPECHGWYKINGQESVGNNNNSSNNIL